MTIRRAAVAMCLVCVLVPALAFASADGRFERSLKVSGTPDLEVSTGSGDITVRTGEASTVRIIGYVHSSDLFGGTDRVKRIESNPPVQQTGNMIRVGRIEDPELRRNISIRYEVWVPASTMLRTNTGSGTVSIEGVSGQVSTSSGSGDLKLANVSGTVRANTGSGSIRADNIAGPFRGQTGSGDVTLRESGAGDVDVSTGSGSVDVQGVKGGLRVRTGSGEIRAAGQPTSSWDMQTGSGDVRVQLPQTGGYDLAMSTSSGDINVHRELSVQGTQNRHRMRGKINGGGPMVELHTSSGDIEVR